MDKLSNLEFFRKVAENGEALAEGSRFIYRPAIAKTLGFRLIEVGPDTFNGDGPVFDESGATNVPGLYLIGDLVVGKKGGSIITAFNSAVRAMKSICIQLVLPAA